MTDSKERKTHFEQVPLEIVKKIAKEDILDDAETGADASVEPGSKKREH